MYRHPTRLPSARQSSSSADVWWISSTTIVSVARMSPSSNQRRAIPVVTMMTFHVGVSGVASRSRLTTPTFSSSVRRISSAIGRIASVLPVPVPATMPKPLPRARQLAHARAVVQLEIRLDVELDRELDRLARRARWRDDDDSAGRRLSLDERFVIGEGRLADVAYHARRLTGRTLREYLRRRLHAGESFDVRRKLRLVGRSSSSTNPR